MTDNLTALEARDQWLYVAHHWPHLRTALAGRSGQALTGMPAAASPEPRLVIDTHVSDLMHEITGIVEGYAAILLSETTWEPSTSRMPQLLTEVAARYGHFVSDPDLTTGFCDDAHDYAEKTRRTLTPTTRPTYLGPCPVPNCEGELRLREDHEHARCPTCGTTTTTTEQRDYLEQQLDQQLLTQAELVQALKILDAPVPFPTLRKWVQRGKLPAYRWLIGPPTQAEAEQPALYRLTDAKQLATRKPSTPSEQSVA